MGHDRSAVILDRDQHPWHEKAVSADGRNGAAPINSQCVAGLADGRREAF